MYKPGLEVKIPSLLSYKSLQIQVKWAIRMLLWCHSFPCILESNPFPWEPREKSDKGFFSCTLLEYFAMHWASFEGKVCSAAEITEWLSIGIRYVEHPVERVVARNRLMSSSILCFAWDEDWSRIIYQNTGLENFCFSKGFPGMDIPQ